MRWFKSSLTAAVGLLAVSVATAQNQNFGQQQPGQFAGQQQAGANLSDMQIATWLSGGNQGEVAIGKLAEQHTDNQKVKDLAREMVRQHGELEKQLARFAGNMAASGIAQQGASQPLGQQNAATPPANQTLTSSTTNPPAAPGQAGTSGLNFIAVIQQMDRQREQQLTRDLGEKHGAEFDKCYVGEQIGAHMEMLDKIRVLRQYASPQLQQVLAQGEQTAQQHLDQFKQLMKSLESNRS